MNPAKSVLSAFALIALFACTSSPGTAVQKLDPRTPAGNATGTTASAKADVTGYWLIQPTQSEEGEFGKGTGGHLVLKQSADGSVIGEENMGAAAHAISDGRNNGGTLTFTTLAYNWAGTVSDDGSTMSITQTLTTDPSDTGLTFNCTRLF